MWEAVAQSLVNISIALIAVDITVYVLATGFLGEVRDLIKTNLLNIEQDEIEKSQNKITELEAKKKKLTAKSKEKQLRSVGRDIEQLIQLKRAASIKKRFVSYKYGFVEFLGCVFVPCTYLLFAILVAVASYLFTDTTISISLLFASAMFIVSALCRIFYSLHLIGQIAIDTEKTRFGKNIEAQKEVQKEAIAEMQKGLVESVRSAYRDTLQQAEAKSKPLPKLIYKTDEPLRMKVNEEKEIDYALTLNKTGAEFAENIQLHFFIQPEIEFIGESIHLVKQASDFMIPDANSQVLKVDELRQNSNTSGSIKLKSLGKVGEFTLRYGLSCKGFSEHPVYSPTFRVIVE